MCQRCAALCRRATFRPWRQPGDLAAYQLGPCICPGRVLSGPHFCKSTLTEFRSLCASGVSPVLSRDAFLIVQNGGIYAHVLPAQHGAKCWLLATGATQYSEQIGVYIQIDLPGFCCLCFRCVFTPPCAAICLVTTNPTLPAGLHQSVPPWFCFFSLLARAMVVHGTCQDCHTCGPRPILCLL